MDIQKAQQAKRILDEINQRHFFDDDEARPFIIYMKAKYMLELDRLNKIFAEIKITI